MELLTLMFKTSFLTDMGGKVNEPPWGGQAGLWQHGDLLTGSAFFPEIYRLSLSIYPNISLTCINFGFILILQTSSRKLMVTIFRTIFPDNFDEEEMLWSN
jgi:hypothetical protein